MNLILQFYPILKSLLNNRTGAVLIAIQTAVTLAIVINATFIISQRIDKMMRPTGMDVEHIVTLASQSFAPDFNAESTTQVDLALLRDLPGVIDAAPSQAIPLSGSGWSSNYTATADTDKNKIAMAMYFTDDHMVNALGITLKAGRNFLPEEISHYEAGNKQIDSVVILTDEAALALYPDGDALGKPVYSKSGSVATIVGIIDHMQGAWAGWEGFNRVMLVPKYQHNRYIIRAEADAIDALLATLEDTLSRADRGRIVRQVRPMDYYLKHAYQEDRAMSIVLATVIVLLIIVAGLGIVSLATFNVNQRTRQIGTHRALGATRMDMLNYFLLENWIITSAGVVVGTLLGIAFNYWLITSFELPSLQWYYIAGGILSIWCLGLASVFAPARTASMVSPALATRNL